LLFVNNMPMLTGEISEGFQPAAGENLPGSEQVVARSARGAQDSDDSL
jgi:hypothetical protein